MNRGTDLATGDYLLQFSSDDWLQPDALEILAAGALDQHPDVGLAHGGVAFVDEAGRPLDRLRWARYPLGEHHEVERLVLGNYIPAIAVLLRRTAVEEAGRYLPDVRLFHDWALWLSVALHGWNLYGVDRAVTCYRRRAGSVTAGASRFDALRDRLSVACLLEARFAGTLIESERRAFATLKRQLRRKLALARLERGDRREARRIFGTLLSRDRDPRAAVGLALSLMPASAFRLLGRVDRRLMQTNSLLAVRLKQLL